MASSIVLKLLKVTHYYRNKRNHKWYLPFGYGAEDIELNNVSLHIYQGEVLGIIGEPESSKTLVGQILGGAINPDKGKVVCKDDIFYSYIEDHKAINQTIENYVAQIVELFNYQINDHKAEQIIHYAHLHDIKERKVSDLTKEQYAQLVLSIARSSKSNIIILNHILTYLSEQFMERALELADDYIDNNQTIVFIDDDVNKIEQVSNYIAWFSHGQLRMEGSLKQVLPVFKEHERDRQSLTDEEEIKNYDLDWKKSRSRIPEMTYNFKRIERYNHAKPPQFLIRFWTIVTTSLLGMLLMAALIFNSSGIISFADNTNRNAIENENKDPYVDKLAYGIAFEGSVTLDGDKSVTLPKYSVVTITGENSKNYKVSSDNKTFIVNKNKLDYFNPAGLYQSHSMKKLAPFMKSNYSNYIDYFNSQLHKQHSSVTKTLVPSDDNRYVAPITQQPIDMLFNDNNQLYGFVYPIVDKAKFKDKFNVNSNIWIAKVGNGYCIANMKENKWIYIEL
ncbi:ATP-binding cassette domain-containing protein [Staphylococcus simiae]|uniref:ABC transporter, ATP-binding protein, putative n=1 Tax=Staphylococcus simiae CCM 7213 = CCUG 51256 TaxID=911238 RepID=G5JJ31_9STAP|nr:ATP-binding cassette domain-containing protein [Staphylococcus simiae]EHJ07802.1 ABC transporter, ATP-binding protein, putative [Staphylococcus simiae CCM 7213 = CCUG 51256]PNZ11908.1 teichoic acid ABC transporter ATP-binding protein [Staphylococcus simiae]SNV75945.1 Teichoic acid export ATP-binding protein TagH [Staphylococcus simiae]